MSWALVGAFSIIAGVIALAVLHPWTMVVSVPLAILVWRTC